MACKKRPLEKTMQRTVLQLCRGTEAEVLSDSGAHVQDGAGADADGRANTDAFVRALKVLDASMDGYIIKRTFLSGGARHQKLGPSPVSFLPRPIDANARTQSTTEAMAESESSRYYSFSRGINPRRVE